nr:hypothetical protein [Flavobacterium rivuli]
MSWPGSSAMLFAGLLPLTVIAITATVKFFSTKEIFYRNIIIRILIYGVPAILLVFYPTLVNEIRYRGYPAYVIALKAADENPDNEALQQKAAEEFSKIQSSSEE